MMVDSAAAEPRANAEPVRVVHESLPSTVAIWWCRLAASSEAIERFASTLSCEETARAARFGPAALRERYIIGRGTLRHLLSSVLGIAPEQVGIVRGRRGRPQVKDMRGIDFNVSHTRDIAVFAIGAALAPEVRLGIDVEHTDREVDADRLRRKILTQSERERIAPLERDARRLAFISLWTCKEAMSKATGDGLSAPFGKFTIEDGSPPSVIDGPPPYQPPYWRLHRIVLRDKYLVTVAIHTRVNDNVG